MKKMGSLTDAFKCITLPKTRFSDLFLVFWDNLLVHVPCRRAERIRLRLNFWLNLFLVKRHFAVIMGIYLNRRLCLL